MVTISTKDMFSKLHITSYRCLFDEVFVVVVFYSWYFRKSYTKLLTFVYKRQCVTLDFTNQTANPAVSLLIVDLLFYVLYFHLLVSVLVKCVYFISFRYHRCCITVFEVKCDNYWQWLIYVNPPRRHGDLNNNIGPHCIIMSEDTTLAVIISSAMAERPRELGDFNGVGHFGALDRQTCYNIAAGSFHAKKLYSRLYSIKVELYSKTQKNAFEPPFRDLWG